MADDSGRNSPATSDGSESTLNEDVGAGIVVMPLSRAKKRVQFHSDENLVRIREIPPRGEQHTTDEEDSGCSEDDDDDDDQEDDEDDTWSNETEKGSSTIPVIVDNAVKLDSVAKGSYDVAKTKGRGSHIVAQITGVSVPISTKLKQKRTVNKDRKPKKIKTSGEKTDSSKSKHKSVKKKSTKKTETEKILPTSKRSKDLKNSKPNTQYSSKSAQPRSPGRCISPVKKTPPKQDLPPSVVTSLPNGFDTHVRSTNIAFQNMSVGKVYTVDGFIFPADPSDQLKAKSLSETTDSEVSKSELSKRVLQRKKCFAWHMANGDQQNVLFGTPRILPLWDSVQSYAPVVKPGIKTKI